MFLELQPKLNIFGTKENKNCIYVPDPAEHMGTMGIWQMKLLTLF